ncbi:MAG: hypothetical protein ACREAO_08335 [Nitrososphaera sp.]
MTIATQVLSFDNFGALESHLQSLHDRYGQTAAKYREALGEIMRSNNGGEGEKWSQEMAAAISGAEKPKASKKSMPKMLSKKDKVAPDAGWVLFDPFSVFVGQGINGQAELYFDAINQLDDTARKLKLAIDILDTLRSKASAPAGVSMTVSFVNDVPSRMILKPVEAGAFKKKSWTFSFAVPPARPALAFPQA